MSESELDEPAAPAYASRRERRAAERLAETGSFDESPEFGAEPVAESPAESLMEPVAEPALEVTAATDPEHIAPRRASKRPASPREAGTAPPRSRRPRFARRIMSVGAMAFAAALAVGLSIPASLFGVAAPSAATPLDHATLTGGGEAAPPAQGIAVNEDIIAAEAPAARDGYSSESYVSIVQANFQAAGIGLDPGNVPPATSVGWPFDHSVPISSGFGVRADGEFHYGIDLDPGEGVPAAAIADGIVTWVGWDNSGYGYYAVIAHNIDGVRVDSLYGHMIDGSSPVYPGQAVTKGTVVGLTGDTGYSFGAHLHLEIHVAGQRVDPYPWMVAHTADAGFTEPLPGPP